MFSLSWMEAHAFRTPIGYYTKSCSYLRLLWGWNVTSIGVCSVVSHGHASVICLGCRRFSARLDWLRCAAFHLPSFLVPPTLNTTHSPFHPLFYYRLLCIIPKAFSASDIDSTHRVTCLPSPATRIIPLWLTGRLQGAFCTYRSHQRPLQPIQTFARFPVYLRSSED